MLRFLIHIVLLLQGTALFGQGVKISEPIKYLALGDSYTIGQGVAEYQRWPGMVYRHLDSLGYNTQQLKYIAQTGWRTDQLLKAIENENIQEAYSLVSLLIGVNDQFQHVDISQYTFNFKKLLLHAIKLAGNRTSGVFVLSIPDYSYTPFGSGNNNISSEIDNYNAINKSISDSLGISYINITPISRKGLENPELIAPDQLHPSGKMYTLWTDLIITTLLKQHVTSLHTPVLQNPKNTRYYISNNFLHIPAFQAPLYQWQVYAFDINGQLINLSLNTTHVNNKYIIDISLLGSGFHFIRLCNKNSNLNTSIPLFKAY